MHSNGLLLRIFTFQDLRTKNKKVILISLRRADTIFTCICWYDLLRHCSRYLSPSSDITFVKFRSCYGHHDYADVRWSVVWPLTPPHRTHTAFLLQTQLNTLMSGCSVPDHMAEPLQLGSLCSKKTSNGLEQWFSNFSARWLPIKVYNFL